MEGVPSAEAAQRFGYTPGSFRVLCHAFRRTAASRFFPAVPPGPRRSRGATGRDRIVALRKQNHSVYEISSCLKDEEIVLSPSAVRSILQQEGFAPLPRRLDDERPPGVRPTVEPVADVREFALEPRKFTTRCGGLFLFLPLLANLDMDALAKTSRLPGSKMIPAAHALRS